MLERDYQPGLIKRIRLRFPGIVVLKNDSGYQQGIPDLSLFLDDQWAMLEVKPREPKGPDDYEVNQEWWIAELNSMSFCACIYPENEEEVLDALQQLFSLER